MSQPPSKLRVLRGFHPIARSLAVYNSENFSHTNYDRRTIGRNLFHATRFTVLFVAIMAISTMNGWNCFLPGLDWSQRAYHLVLMLCLVQQLFIFASMTKRNRRISDALEHLQKTVDNRKLSHYVFLSISIELMFSFIYQ